IESYLAGGEDESVGFDALRIRADGSGSVFGRNEFFHSSFFYRCSNAWWAEPLMIQAANSGGIAMRKVSVIAGVCALVCLLGLFGRSEQTAKASRGAAPQFSLPDAKGAPVKLTDYKGKVVLLNFWATWCHGCVEEIPWFIDFQQKYKDQGLVVV